MQSRVLIEANADVNLANAGGVTPLNAAAQNGNLQIAKLLIEAHANINTTDNNGCTPLWRAGTTPVTV